MTCFVSGCFDLFHAGHVEFLMRAAEFGDLYVSVGRDETVVGLKGRRPLYTQEERRFIVASLSCVRSAFLASGSGLLDFERDLRELKPDVFVVNEDGACRQKEELCRQIGIDYRVLTRKPAEGLPHRSTTSLLGSAQVPYRVDLAGGWLDQPFVSRHHSGPVITMSIEASRDFEIRSGLAASTRRAAAEVWPHLRSLEPEPLARVLFAMDNPPGSETVSGSQDAIGLAFPGVAKSDYEGDYWPCRITQRTDEAVLAFLEQHIRLVSLGPREEGYDVLAETSISTASTRRLSVAAEQCWSALMACDLKRFGACVTESFQAQVSMFPRMLTESVAVALHVFDSVSYGSKLCGAGGGGYLMLVTDAACEKGIRVSVRR